MPLWANAWQLAHRSISSSVTCRAASLLLTVLLQKRLVDYGTVVDLGDAMAGYMELSGPAVLADASCSFWEAMLKTVVENSPGAFNSLCDRILDWLFTKWTPSKFVIDARTGIDSSTSQATSTIGHMRYRLPINSKLATSFGYFAFVVIASRL